ncbi:MAG: glycosyltransferase family 39 protein [Betaproteobacteria bacterium]|nr:glycosyltransferase family 39 protein [Betaproteobacteria bacterium]MDE2056417.1 glycosyltransferase family 39 protein [Betaproteobacteria bacterium]
MLNRHSNNFLKLYWLLGGLAVLSFLPSLWFYAVGEEGVYTIGAMEMWIRHDYLHQTTFGEFYNRPPMIVWAIGMVATLTGFKQIVLAARLVSLLSTLGMAFLTGILARLVINDRGFILFSSLITLTLGDLFFYRGWLAYADPLLGFFTMASITLMVFGLKYNSPFKLLLSGIFISAAFLTKSLTPFAIWYSALFVLSWDHKNKRLHYARGIWLIIPIPVLIAVIWFGVVNQHQQMGQSMMSDVIQKVFASESIVSYVKKIIIFPFNTALNLSPWVPLALVILIIKRRINHPLIQRLSWLVIINLLPYWLAPQSHIRYLISLYPLIGIVSAYIIWVNQDALQPWIKRLLITVVTLKCIFVLFLYPYYQSHFRGLNYTKVAQDLLHTADNLSIYTTDGRSVGLNVVNEIDRVEYGKRFITIPPLDWQNAFLLSMTQITNATLYQTLKITGDTIYVYCRGPACQRPSHLNNNY